MLLQYQSACVIYGIGILQTHIRHTCFPVNDPKYVPYVDQFEQMVRMCV